MRREWLVGGACEWPSQPPPGVPFEPSVDLLGVTFSGAFGVYGSVAADTWYPSVGADGSLLSPFADGTICMPPPLPPPAPPPSLDLQPLLWFWCADAQDNILTTASFLPEDWEARGCTYAGVAGYCSTSADVGLQLWRGGANREYFTTSGPEDEREAAAANYTLITPLGCGLPGQQPLNVTAPVPATANTDNAGAPAGTYWSDTFLLYSAARNDHLSFPWGLAIPQDGYAPLRPQGFVLVAPSADGGCVTVYSQSGAQGIALLTGSDPGNLTLASVAAVAHPPVNFTLSGDCPPPYSLYPSSVLQFGGAWVYNWYLLPYNQKTRLNNLGPLMAFAVSLDRGASWSYAGSPYWDPDHGGALRGVFEPLSVSYPLKVGVARWVDFGPDLAHSPDGRGYLIAKGCTVNDGTWCGFMTGDSAYLARTRLPFSQLAGNLSALNDAESWEFFAGPGQPYAPELAGARPLFEWEHTVGGMTLTYNAPLKKFLLLSNRPSDGISSLDCHFDTYLLEADAVDGPYRLVSYMQSLGPQMYFQHASSAFWSADGAGGTMFSSGNWDGSCVTQGSNPPGERYGLVTTQFGLVLRSGFPHQRG